MQIESSEMRKQASVHYLVRALAMALPAIMLGLQISGWIFFVPSIRDGHPDFRANYTAGYLVKTGQLHSLYDYNTIESVQNQLISREKVGMPFIHPAYEALAYVPFSFLAFHGAYVAFLITNLLLLLFSYRLLLPELKRLEKAWKPLPIALCLTFLPVSAALMQGQDSILLLTIFVCGWVLFSRNKDFRGGLLLGLGLFRFQFLIPVYLLFLLWRRWRIVAGITLSASISLLVSILMVGFDGVRSYMTSLASMSIGGVSQLDLVRYAQPIEAMGSLRALVSGTLSPWVSAVWVQIVILVLSLSILFWIGLTARSETHSSDLLLLAVTASVIVGYHVFTHDLTILLLPIAVWLSCSIDYAETGTLKHVLWGSALMFTAPMLIAFPFVHLYWVTLPAMAFLAAQSDVLRKSQRCTGPAEIRTTAVI